MSQEFQMNRVTVWTEVGLAVRLGAAIDAKTVWTTYDMTDSGLPFYAETLYAPGTSTIARRHYEGTAVSRWVDLNGEVVLGMKNGDSIILVL